MVIKYAHIWIILKYNVDLKQKTKKETNLSTVNEVTVHLNCYFTDIMNFNIHIIGLQVNIFIVIH